MTNELTADGLRELVAKMSPGPWELFGPYGSDFEPMFRMTAERTLFLEFSACPDGFVIGENTANAAGVQALVNAAPQIIDLIEREARMREALEGMVNIQDILDEVGACDASVIKPAVSFARAALQRETKETTTKVNL